MVTVTGETCCAVVGAPACGSCSLSPLWRLKLVVTTRKMIRQNTTSTSEIRLISGSSTDERPPPNFILRSYGRAERQDLAQEAPRIQVPTQARESAHPWAARRACRATASLAVPSRSHNR